MKHLYRYTIVDPAKAFEELAKTQNSNIVKQTTFRLLYNTTPIRPVEKCTMCQKKATETHIFVYCREIKDTKKDLHKTIRSLTDENVDINKIILTNILPQGRGLKESMTINRMIHEYRHLIWIKYVYPRPEDGGNSVPLIHRWEGRRNKIETDLRDTDG